MAGFPDNAVDFILTDPPYLVGFRDRSGRAIAGDKTDEWLQPEHLREYFMERLRHYRQVSTMLPGAGDLRYAEMKEANSKK